MAPEDSDVRTTNGVEFGIETPLGRKGRETISVAETRPTISRRWMAIHASCIYRCQRLSLHLCLHPKCVAFGQTVRAMTVLICAHVLVFGFYHMFCLKVTTYVLFISCFCVSLVAQVFGCLWNICK